MMRSVMQLATGAIAVAFSCACTSSLSKAPTRAATTQVSSAQPSAGAAAVAADSAQSNVKVGAASPPDQASNTDAAGKAVDDAMRKRGYKPALYRGARVYCRNESLTGSNLKSEVCLTAEQIADLATSGKDLLDKTRQAGCQPTKEGCN